MIIQNTESTPSHSRPMQYTLLSAEQHAHFAVMYDRLARSSDEMSTKTSRILVSIMWSNFRHNLSFVNEN